MDQAFIQSRIDAAKARIEQLEQAIAALADPTVTEYEFDDGQNSQKAKRPTISALEKALNGQTRTLVYWSQQLNCNGPLIGRPGW